MTIPVELAGVSGILSVSGIPGNVAGCQSLSLWERCLRSRRRGQGCCQRARRTAIRTLLVRAIVSLCFRVLFCRACPLRRWRASSPKGGALGKEGSSPMKPICVCWKTSRNAKASPTRGGGIERSEDVGEVVQSSTCVILLTLKASFVQPLSLASARQLSWQESPWQRGFVFDETDWGLLENVTECQSLSLWERCLRSRRRGQGC